MAIQFGNMGQGTTIAPRRSKYGIGAMLFQMLICGMFVAFLGFFVLQAKIDPGWVRVQGEVTSVYSGISDGSTTYSPIVSYVVDGVTYTVTSNASSSVAPSIGSAYEVAYNPTNHSQAKLKQDGVSIFSWVFLTLSSFGLLIAPVLYVRALLRSKKISSLKSYGNKIQGVITDIRSTGSTNNEPTYVVTVTANSATGVTTFKSDTVIGMGLNFIDFRTKPVSIDVYVDPLDASKYYVDVDMLPSLTGDRIAEVQQVAMMNGPAVDASVIGTAPQAAPAPVPGPQAVSQNTATPIIPPAAPTPIAQQTPPPTPGTDNSQPQ